MIQQVPQQDEALRAFPAEGLQQEAAVISGTVEVDAIMSFMGGTPLQSGIGKWS